MHPTTETTHGELPPEPYAQARECAADAADAAARLNALLITYVAAVAQASRIGPPLATEHHSAIGALANELISEIRASVGEVAELLALVQAAPPADA